jgi:hypothetical protein
MRWQSRLADRFTNLVSLAAVRDKSDFLYSVNTACLILIREISAETTAPSTFGSASRIRIPAGTGAIRPPEMSVKAAKKVGSLSVRAARARPPIPIPRAPEVFARAICGRIMLLPS